MTINGFGTLLILVARMKIYIAQLEKAFNDQQVEFGRHECIDMITTGRRILEEPP